MSGASDVIAVTITADTLAADDDGISANAAVGNNAALTIGGALADGGSVTLSNARKVTITSAGDDDEISKEGFNNIVKYLSSEDTQPYATFQSVLLSKNTKTFWFCIVSKRPRYI